MDLNKYLLNFINIRKKFDLIRNATSPSNLQISITKRDFT